MTIWLLNNKAHLTSLIRKIHICIEIFEILHYCVSIYSIINIIS